MVRLEFTKALANAEIAWIDRRLDGVVGELSRPGAGPELKEEYRDLQTRKQAMKLRLKGDID